MIEMKQNTVMILQKLANRILKKTEYDSKNNYYYFVLICAPILLTVYLYFTQAQNFMRLFPAMNTHIYGEVYAYLLEYLAFFILMLVVPLTVSMVNKRSDILMSLFTFKNLRKNLLWVSVILVLIVIPAAYHASTLSSVTSEYPLPKTLMQNQQLLPVYFLSLTFLYYLSWEFFFRGFLLFGLKDKYGTVPAILIQTISSCLVHIGKPAPEIIGSIPFGIIFGIIAIRTKSIWILVLLHASLGIFTDVFIIY